MSRLLVLAGVAFLLSACGGAGRCTTNQACPIGASCDASLGVCVLAAGASTAPASSNTPATSTKALAANYSHACTVTSDCADVPGTVCHRGTCLSSCQGQSECAAGSYCGVGVREPYCFKACQGSCNSPDLGCYAVATAAAGFPAGTSLCGRTAVSDTSSPIGGDCNDSGDCAGSARCMEISSRPNFCSHSCSADPASCGDGSACVGTTATDAFCFARCSQPGTQSTCRSGFSCRALEGRTYGACL